MVASTLLRNSVSITEWLTATTFLKLRNIVLWKKLFPTINYIKLQGKNGFGNNYSTLRHSLLSLYLLFHLYINLLIDVCTSVSNWRIGALWYFSVYKLITWGPANIYLFKFNCRTKRSKLCLKLTTKKAESCSGVFIVNFEYFFFFQCFYCWL